MNKEFFAALNMLEKEKGIPKEYMYEKIEAALVSAFKKEYGNNTNVRVVIDENKEDVRVYRQKEVVEEVENPETQISLEEAKKIAKKYVVGSFVETEVKPKNFRRLSAGILPAFILPQPAPTSRVAFSSRVIALMISSTLLAASLGCATTEATHIKAATTENTFFILFVVLVKKSLVISLCFTH